MDRRGTWRVIAVAFLISMAFPLVVAADEPPPEGPSIESPMLVPLESFEGWEFPPPEGPSIQSPMVLPNESFEGFAFPPSGWAVKQKNVNQTWVQRGHPFLWPNSGVQAAVVYPHSDPQKEVLLTPKIYAPNIYLILHTMTTSVATCGTLGDACDLEVWVVRGAWGGGDDLYQGVFDGSWTTDNTWVRNSFFIGLEGMGIYKPIRIGFRYVGQNGAMIALDDVTVIAVNALNKNWSFERGGTMPTAWEGRNLTALDKRDDSQAWSGSWSFKMKGSSANKTLIQTISISGHAHDRLMLWGCSKSVNAVAGRPYEVIAIIYHRDGSREIHKIKFASGSHDWQLENKTILTKEPYNRIDLEIRYWNQGGKAWFEGVQITHV